MKRTMKTGFRRELKQTRGRFISIMLLMFLSTFTLVGLKLVGPDIRMMANGYLNDYNLADISITSTYGLDENDVDTINKLSDAEVEYGYFTDVTTSENKAIRVFSNTENVSKFELVEGRMPRESNEIAITNQLRSEYPIGSVIDINEKGSDSNHVLKYEQYKVVGYVNSLEILSKVDLGPTNVGTGSLDGYAVIDENDFASEVYMIARVSYSSLRNEDAFLEDYLNDVSIKKDEIENLLKNRPEERLNTVKEEAKLSIDKNKKKLVDAQAKLDEGQSELDAAKIKLNDAKANLDAAKISIESNQAKIDEGQSELEKGKVEIEEAAATLAEKQAKLNDAQDEIDAAYTKLKQEEDKLNAAKAKLDSGQSAITDSINELETYKTQYEDGLQEIKTGIEQINLALSDPSLTESQIAQYKAKLSQLQLQLDALNKSYNDFMSQTYEPNIKTLNSKQLEINSGYKQIENGQNKIDDSRGKLASSQIDINNGQVQIDNGQKQIDASRVEISNNEKLLDEAQVKINTGQQEYENGYAEYQEALIKYNDGAQEFNEEKLKATAQIEEGYKEIEEAELEINELVKPVYTVNTRSETSTSGGYQILTSLATSIDKVANIFPILLYAVAALVTFTTMTRFVEDDRINTGTLLSLGYTEGEIIQKYVVYGAISSSVGAILGIIGGAIVIPNLLYTAFRGDFTTPDLIFTFNFKVAIIALVVSLLCAVIPAFVVASAEFKYSPASLLLPKPPSDGSKIFLERISFIWNRLSFSHKVTARNIFRYKKRMFMTIFGVSGSVALLFTGLGMQGSIGSINELQFGQIINYDMMSIVSDTVNLEDEKTIAQFMESDEIADYKKVYIENLNVIAGDNNERQTITLTVADNFDNYVKFRDRTTQQTIELEPGSVIISERLADILSLQVGDDFTVKSSENDPIKLKVGAVTEMYMGHFMYATPETYEMAFGTVPQLNSYLVKLNDNSSSNVAKVASDLLKLDGVQTIMQNETLKTQVTGMSDSLNSVMTLIIVLSALLAIVILYNITNINVNERMRELSTTKVLGYYDNEVTMYIYRETIILSLIGIFTGFGIGRLIHLFMMKAVSPLNMMFDQSVVMRAFIIPALLIVLISVILGVLVHKRLTKVDMLEALKSVE